MKAIHSRCHAAFTWVEGGIAIAVAIVLILAAVPFVTGALTKAVDYKIVSDIRELDRATQQMALDRIEYTNSSIGFPGDIGGTFTNWVVQMVRGQYIGSNQISLIFSAPGQKIPLGSIPTLTNTAILAYAVRFDSEGNPVFLSTANFTNTPTGGIFSSNVQGFGSKQFFVERRDGSGALLKAKKAGDINAVGGYVPLCK